MSSEQHGRVQLGGDLSDMAIPEGSEHRPVGWRFMRARWVCMCVFVKAFIEFIGFLGLGWIGWIVDGFIYIYILVA